MRGLKYATSDAWEIALLSHPSRMRGLKYGARKTILYTLKKRKEEKNGWNYYQKGNITYIRQWK